MAKKLTNAPSGKFGLVYWYSDFYYHAALMNGFGGGVFAGRKPTLNSPQNVASLDYLLKWINQGFMPAEPSTALITSLFNQRQGGDGLLRPLVPRRDRQGRSTTAWRRCPRSPRPATSRCGRGSPSRGSTSPRRRRTRTPPSSLLKYLTDVPAAKVLALEGRQTPANKGVYADAQVAADPVLKAFRQQVDVAVPMPNLPEMSMVWSPATTAMNTDRQEGGRAEGRAGPGAEGSAGAHRQPAEEVSLDLGKEDTSWPATTKLAPSRTGAGS